MTRLRVTCLGGGFIAGRHLAALSGFADVQIAAVADTVSGWRWWPTGAWSRSSNGRPTTTSCG
jgi:hypothetical protein